ncbi:DUF799 domain-containing protein [Marinimicrobium sp. C2-29]|uniref:DUF799 domain-containing protein n=1 Tax=Marinimicrobium sp. C2-29 TaxID=3139825 RepID=UPI0031390DF0
MIRLLLRSGTLALMVLVAGCAVNQESADFTAFHDAQPKSILVVPVVNESVDVQAPLSVLTTLPKTLGEKGYYIFPVNTVKTLLEYEGLYEPAVIHNTPPEQLASLFGADAILYVTIHEWTAQYVVLQTTTVVDFEYRIVNHDGAELWSARKQLSYTPQNHSSGNPLADLIASAITAALERADPNYLPLTRQANQQVFYQGATAIPPGPYSPNYKEYYLALENQEETAD